MVYFSGFQLIMKIFSPRCPKLYQYSETVANESVLWLCSNLINRSPPLDILVTFRGFCYCDDSLPTPSLHHLLTQYLGKTMVCWRKLDLLWCAVCAAKTPGLFFSSDFVIFRKLIMSIISESPSCNPPKIYPGHSSPSQLAPYPLFPCMTSLTPMSSHGARAAAPEELEWWVGPTENINAWAYVWTYPLVFRM